MMASLLVIAVMGVGCAHDSHKKYGEPARTMGIKQVVTPFQMEQPPGSGNFVTQFVTNSEPYLIETPVQLKESKHHWGVGDNGGLFGGWFRKGLLGSFFGCDGEAVPVTGGAYYNQPIMYGGGYYGGTRVPVIYQNGPTHVDPNWCPPSGRRR